MQARATPFLALFALRRRYLREQSQALYRRYGHALAIFGAFFAIVLVERPSLLAAPILQFWRDPADWRANLAHVAGFLAVVALWARVHRGFVAGASFAVFARTSSHGWRLGPALDLSLLLVALQWFALPFAVAAWVVVAADARPPGPGGQFWASYLVLLLLTVVVARAVVFGAGRARAIRAGGALAVLVCGALPGDALAGNLLLFGAAALLAFDLARPAGRPATARVDAGADGRLRGPGLWFLFLLQSRALVRAHLHVALPRIGLPLLLHAVCWWMIHGLGKRQDAAGFIALACCVTAYALAGLYYAYWEARQPMQPFLRSLPFGVARTLLAEHLVVLGAALLSFGLVWLGYRYLPAAGAQHLQHAAWLLRCAGLSVLLLALLGAPILQRHRHGVGLKVALSVAAFLTM